MYNTIPEKYLIRKNCKNKNLTMNNYKKSEILKELEKNIFSDNIEKSILWGSELLASGYSRELYKKLFDFFLTDINKCNINLIQLFHKELTYFFNTLKDKEYDYRNSQYFRNHVADIITILTFSTKCKLPKLPKIIPEMFNMKNNTLLTKNLEHIKQFVNEDDNKNIIIPLSEIYLNLNIKNLSKSFDNALYWLHWIMLYEKNSHKDNLKCHYTKVSDVVDEKYRYDFTWIVWNIIFHICNKNEYINLLYNIYCLDFTKATKKKKINILILVFLILIDPIPTIQYQNPIITEKNKIIKNKIILSINLQYQDLLNNIESTTSLEENKKKKISPFFSKEKFYPNVNMKDYRVSKNLQ